MTSYPCPACGATADLAEGCPGCGRAPDPAAAEVIRLDLVIGELAASAQAARVAYDQATRELEKVRSRRNALAAEVRAWSREAASRPAAPPSPVPPPVPVTAVVRPEASARTVQNVLFTLGGLLLGTAAVVFTAVAWATFRETGRAVILAIVTGLALATPLLALRRRLFATAETFAALGLLLVVLDGYATWHVNLFGLADTVAPSTYAAGVAAVTAAVSAGYGRATGLTGPRVVALVVAQPVLPLSTMDASPSPAGWAVVYALVAAADLALLRWLHGMWRGLAFVLSGLSVVVAGANALQGEVFAVDADDALRAGLAMLVVVAVLLAGAAASGVRAVREAAAGAAAVAVVVAAGRYVALAVTEHRLVLITALTATVAVIARVAVPPGWRLGARIGSGATLGAIATVVVVLAGWAAWLTVSAALPAWHADLATVSFLDWGLPVSVVLVAIGGIAALPRAARGPASALAALLAAVSLAPALALPWWAPSTVDVIVVAVLVAAARWPRLTRPPVRPSSTAAQPAGPSSTGAQPAGPSSTGASSAAPPSTGASSEGSPSTRASSVVPPSTGASSVGSSSTGASSVGSSSTGASSVGSPSTFPLSVGSPSTAAPWAGQPQVALWEWAAMLLAGHAVIASLARPSSTAGTLWSLVAVGGLMLVVGHRRQVGLAVAMVLVPPAVQATVVGAGGTGSAALRWGLAAAGLGVAVVAATAKAGTQVRLGAQAGLFDLLPSAVIGASVAVAYASSTAALGDGEPYGVHGAVGLLLLAAIALLTSSALRISRPKRAVGRATSSIPGATESLMPPLSESGAGVTPRHSASWAPGRRMLTVPAVAATVPAVPAALGAVPGLVTVLILPYSWLASVWSGVPGRNPGLTPWGTWPVDRSAVTLILLTVAATIAGAVFGRRGAVAGALLVGPAAVLVSASATEARWPTVPFLALVLGLACALGVTLARWPVPAAGYAFALTGAGLAGLLPAKATTLAGLGLVVVVAAALRTAIGWLTSFSAAVLLAIAVTRAAELPLRSAAYAVLAVAAVALAASRGRAVVVEVAAHAGAVVAVVLAGGSLGHTAAIFTLWGIALGVCALQPGPRVAYAGAAAGSELVAWWLLLSAREVAVLEAYTLPAAALAALVGVLALRRRPELRSWMAYGPALAAGFLPSLASALTTTSDPARRLLLGVGAVAVVCAGAVRRRQAPVAVGGLVLVALALREMAVWWDLIPRWIPLAAAGFLLVGLAMTYERRRRDLTRLREGYRRLT